MSNYIAAWDALAEAIGSADGQSVGSISEISHLTREHKLEVAKIAAILSVSQELSKLNPNNNEDGEPDNRMFAFK